MLGEPPRTPYDVSFPILGVNVRVTPWFWLMAVVLGYSMVVSDSRVGEASRGLLFALWIAAVFLSILIHELGHSMAFRRYGIDSYIVLYHFGGVAVPSRSWGFQASQHGSTNSRVIISAAGPGAQLAAAGIVMILVRLSGHAIPNSVYWLLDWFAPQPKGLPDIPMPMYFAVDYFLWPSVFWALLNLIPVYPLDGGQIAREWFGVLNSFKISMAAAAAVVLFAFTLPGRPVFLMVMFAVLGYQSYQA